MREPLGRGRAWRGLSYPNVDRWARPRPRDGRIPDGIRGGVSNPVGTGRVPRAPGRRDGARAGLRAISLHEARGRRLRSGAGLPPRVIPVRGRQIPQSRSGPQPELLAECRLENESGTMKAATSNDCRARIDRVLTHLADHLDADLSVAELARIAHFSPYHFHRMFRAMTGESVAALVRRLRLETAGRALRERDGSVTDVALAAGYRPPAAFTPALPPAFAAAPSDYHRPAGAPRYISPPALDLTLHPS